ncbi:MAG: hypothetical protein M3542_11170 [Acidobacteriota bacterium]|nr:hypothetical protein [Acidobacteriota bacterium]MDQ5872877.1 hypothetical protein [Acidobacteriota bacterium]
MTLEVRPRLLAGVCALLLFSAPVHAAKVSAKRSGDVYRGATVWAVDGVIKTKEARALDKCRSDRGAAEKSWMRSEDWQPCPWSAPTSFTERAREVCNGGKYTVRVEEWRRPGKVGQLTVIGPYGSHTSSYGPSDHLTWYLVCDAEVRAEPADRCEGLVGEARKTCYDEEVDTYTHYRCWAHFRGKRAYREHVAAGCRPVACHDRAREGDVERTSGNISCVCRNRGDGVLEWFFPDGTRCDWDK